MNAPPLLIALRDAGLLRRISAEFAANGRPHHVTADGTQLLGAIAGPTDLVVDPALFPEGTTPDGFVSQLVELSAGGRVLVQAAADGSDEERLIQLGANDLFTASTNPALVVRRLEITPPAEVAEPARATEAESSADDPVEAPDESAEDEHGASAPQPASEAAHAPPIDSLDGFTERVAVRLARARDRERGVALFCFSVRGSVDGGDPRQGFMGVLEGVLEDLDRSEEMTCSGSRIATAPVGEDLYAVLVPDVERVQDAARLAVRFHEAMTSSTGTVTHVGIACSPDDGTIATELIERSREAVLRARREGQNHVEFFSSSMSRWAFERLTLEQSLRDALRNRELVVYYQPRVDVETRAIIGMEALVRWIHPQFGLVSPGQFIPLAEETGLINPIGDWVLRESCRQNAEWRRMGLPRIRVSVNLSPVQFRKTSLHESVVAALRDAELEPDGLELEVTESLLMNDPSETAAVLGRLRGEGIHISIDDFGTGQSSLAYLQQLPVDELKIDRSFVQQVDADPRRQALLKSIVG
ncbi:MAG: GGDEF domain-containing phosphodiesterase, partial [Planctomycetota bacterium]